MFIIITSLFKQITNKKLLMQNKMLLRIVHNFHYFLFFFLFFLFLRLPSTTTAASESSLAVCCSLPLADSGYCSVKLIGCLAVFWGLDSLVLVTLVVCCCCFCCACCLNLDGDTAVVELVVACYLLAFSLSVSLN